EAIFLQQRFREQVKQRADLPLFALTYRKSLLGGVHAPACGLKMKGLRPLHASPGEHMPVF
ncbi:MAG: hypothetical protein SPE01_08095, partial [Candidatus Spyradocola sp.]|nr:hypothetical protein [Candidatus Spyradocola sp.]